MSINGTLPMSFEMRQQGIHQATEQYDQNHLINMNILKQGVARMNPKISLTRFNDVDSNTTAKNNQTNEGSNAPFGKYVCKFLPLHRLFKESSLTPMPIMMK